MDDVEHLKQMQLLYAPERVEKSIQVLVWFDWEKDHVRAKRPQVRN